MIAHIVLTARIALFEVRKRLCLVSTYIYFLIYLSIAFFLLLAMGGAFPQAGVTVGGSGGKTFVNSPFVLFAIISTLSYFGIIITAAVMGQAVYQDFHHQTHTLFFTSPIHKLQYLIGRFLGATIVLLLIFSSIGIGALIAGLTPFVDQKLFGPHRLYAYVHPYLIIVLPNIIAMGALFFSLSTLSRKILPVYVTSVVLLIGYLIASVLTSNVEWKLAAALIDPFGTNALGHVTEYWTITERNALYVPLAGALLANRLIWLGVGVGLFAWTAYRLKRVHGVEHSRTNSRIDDLAPGTSKTGALGWIVPKTEKRDFRMLRFLPSMAWLQFKETVKNVYFAVIALAGVMFMFLAAQTMSAIYGTETYPITALVLELVGGSFNLFMLIIIVFYSGELIWRERDANIDQICDALPTPNWLPWAAKTVALIGVQALLLGVVMLCGLTIQAFQGYFHFEIGLYVRDLFGIQLFEFALIAILAMTVQALVSNKYLGHFVMVLYYLATTFAAQFGFQHKLWRYGATPGYTYSDMNGYGHFLDGVAWFDAYWAIWAILLSILANLFWVRGTEASWRGRVHQARERLTPRLKVLMGLTLVGIVGMASWIYYNTAILNPYRTSHQVQKETADYERQYKSLETTPQPRVVDVKVNFDLWPEERSVRAKGSLLLKNKTKEPIKTIYVNCDRDLTIHQLSIGEGANALNATTSDKKLGFYTYELAKPLEVGVEVSLVFDIEDRARGFRNDSGDSEVVYNGTFFNSTKLPSIGYQPNREIPDETNRRKHGLPPRERMPDINDQKARANHYISNDSDWISLDATVSTSPDQIAIIPGYLQREWQENGRRFFHYKTDGKILNFFSVLSARYEVKRDKWTGPVSFGKSSGTDSKQQLAATNQDVSIEIYYQPGHEYNLDKMVEGIKDSLDYFTKNFSPYQHRQVRIIEFPRYAQFAQSFPNTIPFSEAIGFVARVDPKDPDDIDYPYYVTAHEVAHQWWAHQVIGANTQGATMLSETMSQYSALMVMKRKFGADKMKRFLRYELDRYLSGRGFERSKELPLSRNENQQYIHYNKGSLVMYAFQDYIGEEAVNRALSKYIQAVAYQEPPYTNALEMVEFFRKETPKEMQYLIEDLFETITLFDNRTVSATTRKIGFVRRGTRDVDLYETTIVTTTKKYRSDEQGFETDLPLSDLMDIALLNEKDEPIVVKKVLVDNEKSEFTLISDGIPAKAGIDPINKLIDRRPDDNVVRVTETTTSVKE